MLIVSPLRDLYLVMVKHMKYSLKTLSDFKLVIWSRDNSAGFFKKLKKHRPDIFHDWQVHDKPVELMYKDNYQSIFYTGDISKSILQTIEQEGGHATADDFKNYDFVLPQNTWICI